MSTVALSGKCKFWFFYSTPVLESFEKAGLIYCLRRDSEFQRRTDIWFMSVSSKVWSLVILTIFVILCFASLLQFNNLTPQNFLPELITFTFYVVRSLTHQTISLHSTRFMLLELICVCLLITYENHITVEIVKKRTQRPFRDLDELYHKNYTFLVKHGIQSPGSIWLTDKYNTSNSQRVFEFGEIASRFWIERILWEQPNGIKYALLDPFYGDNIFEFIKAVSHHLYTCHKLYPKIPFFSQWRHFTYLN